MLDKIAIELGGYKMSLKGVETMIKAIEAALVIANQQPENEPFIEGSKVLDITKLS